MKILSLVILVLAMAATTHAQCTAPANVVSKKVNSIGCTLTFPETGANMYQIRWKADGDWHYATQITPYSRSGGNVTLLIPKLTAVGNPFFGIKTGDICQVAHYCNIISGYPTSSDPLSDFSSDVVVKIKD